MPIISKYSSQKIENILNEVMDVLHNNDVSVDLSLMILGNSITHIINGQVPTHKRAEISEKFVKALSASINKKDK
ncbi:hypothetical protein PCNPT3_07245 [Psychromonas sp. CNPT3]|uniref:DUF1414 domain-containing protein n=1 Tax=Psychromonas sp. CNPT3 TaxID=314282 RepID=UPI0002C05BB4|nr:DUF1414 domain-containing protein [Psychromonas sp. CNPT3]AGH81387.1 hypothetical protein PCNPT3_07245 [Psychromonas sp. CNPT3]